VIIGIIIGRIYLQKSFTKNKKNKGTIVFFQTTGFLSGAILGMFLVVFLGANSLLILSSLILLITINYLTTNSKRGGKLVLLISLILLITTLFIYSTLNLDYEIEKQRNVQKYLWYSDSNYNLTEFENFTILEEYNKKLHLFSGWSSYSKIDIYSWSADCIGGAYNYRQQWITCPSYQQDFDFRKILYSQLSGRTVIIGSGGGMGCLTLYSFNKSKLTCIEIDSLVVNLMKTKFSLFNNNIYNKVETKSMDGREFLENTNEKFDVIIYEGLDFTVGKRTKTLIEIENYLYTIEGLTIAVEKLNENGVIIIGHGNNEPLTNKLGKNLEVLKKKYKISYSYYNISTIEPIHFLGSLLILSRNSTNLEKFARISDNNSEIIIKETLIFSKNKEVISDNKPFFYNLENNFTKLLSLSVILFLISIILIKKKRQLMNSYFFILGTSFILIELFTLTYLKSFFIDYTLTFIITTFLMLLFLSLGSLKFQKFNKPYYFPIIFTLYYFAFLNINHYWHISIKILFSIITIGSLFFFLGSYFPKGLTKIKKEEFPKMYLLDSLGTVIGFFIFYIISMSIGISNTFIIAAILYIFLLWILKIS